jgi:hypothetical protein
MSKKNFSDNEFVQIPISIENNINFTRNAIINITALSNNPSSNEVIHTEEKNFKPYEKHIIDISRPFAIGVWKVITEIQYNNTVETYEFPFRVQSIQDLTEIDQANSPRKTAEYTYAIVFISIVTTTSSIIFAYFTLRQQRKGMESTLMEMKAQTQNASKSIKIAVDSLKLSQKQMILQNRPLVFRYPEDKIIDEVDMDNSRFGTPTVESYNDKSESCNIPFILQIMENYLL